MSLQDEKRRYFFMIQDLHSHTYYSFCGKDSPEAVIKNAIANGIETVGISDHYYGIVMNRNGVLYRSDEEKISMHTSALKRYYEHIKLLSDKYKDYIKVWCGVEIATLDLGYTLLADGVDVSMFDYCLIEHISNEETTVSDVFDFAAYCGCEKTGIAHTNLPSYIALKNYDMDIFFKKMAEQGIFWELNVNYDSIHNYNEHKYVKDFFDDDKILDAVKKSGVKMSVGFDGHRLEDYDISRVKDACYRLEELSIPMVR
ncbi:MAG: PHP domain-containing protein [Ruminococcaceae bacterium]|nr:PHP domain-containing protein [Oscillospiraceae bacterium]